MMTRVILDANGLGVDADYVWGDGHGNVFGGGHGDGRMYDHETCTELLGCGDGLLHGMQDGDGDGGKHDHTD